jgi:predicted secreted protein
MDYSVTPNVKKDNFVGGSSTKIPLTRNAHPTAPMVGKFIEIQDQMDQNTNTTATDSAYQSQAPSLQSGVNSRLQKNQNSRDSTFKRKRAMGSNHDQKRISAPGSVAQVQNSCR